MSNLAIEGRQGRIESARNHSTAFSGDTTVVEVSISNKTAKEFGYQEQDSKYLYRKDKDGKTLDGWYLMNENCPKIASLEDAQVLAEELNLDLVKLINAKVTTEFQNAVRAHLNRKADSKKAEKQAQASAIQAAMLAGELEPAEAMRKLASLI